MSRHTIKGRNPNHDVVVGWDPPLRTYFAIVLDPTKDEEDEGYSVMWIGTSLHEIVGLVDLQEEIRHLASIPSDILLALFRDRHNNAA